MKTSPEPMLPREHASDKREREAGDLRRAKRWAHREELFGVALGISLMVIGIASAVILRPYHWWPVMLVMLGPIVVFLSFMGFFTFLERVEEDRFFPDQYKRKEFETRDSDYHPGAWNP